MKYTGLANISLKLLQFKKSKFLEGFIILSFFFDLSSFTTNEKTNEVTDDVMSHELYTKGLVFDYMVGWLGFIVYQPL